jgi:hypothetical protein
MSDPSSIQTTAQITRLLDESEDELLSGCVEALKGVHKWMGQVREGRWDFWISKADKKNRLDKTIERYDEMKKTLEDVLQRFRYDKRYCGRRF